MNSQAGMHESGRKRERERGANGTREHANPVRREQTQGVALAREANDAHRSKGPPILAAYASTAMKGASAQIAPMAL
eukprot:CAMPEP_0176191400 /NCGR_PEP_ID=MMETSP0121_2-20121125/4441_1 /TAXON_ID=160619 /ORGANISM="Kryptoperidinium foliaceum, Strain CCMP 1326" /LENGTH=76 /DNA_ID=CAMNT_0017530065 /DNA_START=259 /DNA_END=489 /DNA_ORIENTATION=+